MIFTFAIRDISLVDPSDEKIADVEWRFEESGARIRVSARCVIVMLTGGGSEKAGPGEGKGIFEAFNLLEK